MEIQDDDSYRQENQPIDQLALHAPRFTDGLILSGHRQEDRLIIHSFR